MTAPRWKPKSRPYNGDTIIAKSSGSNIKLACPAYGYPKPTTTWYKNDVLFDANQRPKVRFKCRRGGDLLKVGGGSCIRQETSEWWVGEGGKFL